jgi:hypothetical protein
MSEIVFLLGKSGKGFEVSMTPPLNSDDYETSDKIGKFTTQRATVRWGSAKAECEILVCEHGQYFITQAEAENLR